MSEQIAYYRACAPEYDQAWVRKGRYDHGEEANRAWWAAMGVVQGALATFAPKGDVLELAAGTGMWTRMLAPYADRVTALDASPEALAINRARLTESGTAIRYVEADMFAWEPHRRSDVVSFAFWLSHVPETRFEQFWDLVDAALAPGGRFFLVDSAPPGQALPAPGEHFSSDGKAVAGIDDLTDLKSGTSLRWLSDGPTFVKVFGHLQHLRLV